MQNKILQIQKGHAREVNRVMNKFLFLHLSKKEKELVKNRDFLGLIKAGGNIYMLIKLGAALGVGLYHMGAQQRGQTYEEFMNTRKASGAR